jgi:hypothetical protein
MKLINWNSEKSLKLKESGGICFGEEKRRGKEGQFFFVHSLA